MEISPELLQRTAIVSPVLLQRPKRVSESSTAHSFERIPAKILGYFNFSSIVSDLGLQHVYELIYDRAISAIGRNGNFKPLVQFAVAETLSHADTLLSIWD